MPFVPFGGSKSPRLGICARKRRNGALETDGVAREGRWHGPAALENKD
jgi:hypothetical protein